MKLVRPSKNPLLLEAMAYSKIAGPKGRMWTKDELELFILWFEGVLNAAQVLSTLKLRGNSVSSHAAMALKQAIAAGHVELVMKDEKK